ncbi:MAG: electron transport complex subunit RsxB [Magnetococcales bacterium]|nr:electron transport complex subunit RsxB [Magnetococcales bacterium]
MIEAVLSMSGLALVAGLGLGFAAKKFHVEGDPKVDGLTALLPATNCGNCGFPGCRPYAEAIATEQASSIGLCTPGGVAVMEKIAAMLGVEPVEMDVDSGPKVAFVREEDCIGCTACIKACPVDAIIGANKQSHTVVAEMCTACKACIEPCPVDCIDMVSVPMTAYTWRWDKPGTTNALH